MGTIARRTLDLCRQGPPGEVSLNTIVAALTTALDEYQDEVEERLAKLELAAGVKPNMIGIDPELSPSAIVEGVVKEDRGSE